jgi:hypothetical protein
MSLAAKEKEVFDQPLTPVERVVGAIMAGLLGLANLVLGATALVFFYVLVTFVL